MKACGRDIAKEGSTAPHFIKWASFFSSVHSFHSLGVFENIQFIVNNGVRIRKWTEAEARKKIVCGAQISYE